VREKMGAEELLEEDAFDPQKLFNEEEYSTLIIGREGFNKKENSTADLLEALLDKGITRQESEDIFSKLKETNSQKVMMDAIATAQRVSEKTVLTAACWECGLDFSAYFLDFVKLATSKDFQLALEALSVVESIENVFEEKILTEALLIAQAAEVGNEDLVNDLIENIKSRIA
jgi:predicted oxidoreductase